MLSLNNACLALFLFSTISYCYAETNYYTNITSKNRLRIGVPAYPFSQKFVHINRAENKFHGFCIDVFEEAIKLLKYEIYYDFVEFDGSYDDLVLSVANKTFDLAVGDITIMSQRYTLVDFTEPYTESGLAMVVPTKPTEGWIFLKPFSIGLWIATGGILVYTMFVVWFIEHRSNEEFSGSRKDQLENALWFTFSSLFFAHRAHIKRSHTRVVVVVWLFVVLILIQSYTASLTSMLTVTRLNPNIDFLRSENAKVGCAGNTFMMKYVERQLGYKSENINLIIDENDYLKAFKNGSISAAFLEIPYAKLFVNAHCKDFTVTGSSYKFGGLSFAFQKGSAITYDVTEAILKLSENGMLKRLEEIWLTHSSECTDSNATDDIDSLKFQHFWGLFLFFVAISTSSFLLYIFRLLKNYPQYKRAQGDDSGKNIWKKLVGLVGYLKNADIGDPRLAPSSSRVVPENEMLEEGNYAIS